MWTYNGIQIIATERADDNPQIIARLNPIGGGTHMQTFGYEDEVTRITCVVVGDTDMDALKALSKTGLSYTLSGAEGVVGSYLLNKCAGARRPVYRQTLRSDLSPYAPVYWVTLELYKNV